MKQVKILYFITDVTPTPQEFQNAAETPAHVVFRNATVVPSEQHALEECDGVMGAVPEIYAREYPSAEEAIRKRERELRDAIAKAGGKAGQQPNLQPLMREHATQKLPITDDEEDEEEDDESEEDDVASKAPVSPGKPSDAELAAQQAGSKGQALRKGQQRVAPPKPSTLQPPAPESAESVKPVTPAWKPNS